MWKTKTKKILILLNVIGYSYSVLTLIIHRPFYNKPWPNQILDGLLANIYEITSILLPLLTSLLVGLLIYSNQEFNISVKYKKINKIIFSFIILLAMSITFIVTLILLIIIGLNNGVWHGIFNNLFL